MTMTSEARKQQTESGRAESTARGLVQIIPLLDRWVQMTLVQNEETDISLRQLAVLEQIASNGATPGEIARSLSVTPAVITGLIDRLERRGFVRRLDSQFDRRRVHLELTVSGDDARVQANRAIVERMEQQFADLNDNELGAIDDAVALLTRVLLATPSL
jgi:DNA-binding MarR family transcriptional regulator